MPGGKTGFERLKRSAPRPSWTNFRRQLDHLRWADDLGDAADWVEGVPASKLADFAGEADAADDPHEQGWTLHQLRHSALQHLAADGRTAPELQAKSRHLHLGSLDRYVQLGEQTSAQVTADADPAARRRTR